MRLLHIYRKDARNVGDMKSSPHLYFRFGAEQKSIDVLEAGNINDWSKYDAVIVGGGGLLQDKWFMPALTHIRDNFHGKVIVWGAGLNNHFYKETICFAPSSATRCRLCLDWLFGRHRFRVRLISLGCESTLKRDAWLNRCDLVGVRDYGTMFDWVPCVSCMDEGIDQHRQTTPRHPLVVVDHPDVCRIGLRGVPRMSNLNNNFADLLAFIASGEILLASSYHAAYWGILLGRRVVVVPWSEKFCGFKHSVPACLTQRELNDCISRSRAYPEALSECRQSNLDFALKTAHLLQLSWSLAYK